MKKLESVKNEMFAVKTPNTVLGGLKNENPQEPGGGASGYYKVINGKQKFVVTD